jgi:hypothetical protein
MILSEDMPVQLLNFAENFFPSVKFLPGRNKDAKLYHGVARMFDYFMRSYGCCKVSSSPAANARRFTVGLISEALRAVQVGLPAFAA